jgi:iron(III) transport system ATP-binding protein
MSAELRIEHLQKVFPTTGTTTPRPAVDDVSFTIAAGEIVVLLGPSGCGKTTTLRCVAGLEHPTGGQISLGGEVISAPAQGILLPPRLRNIGMVFQSYAVWPHMTVRQNVAYPLKGRGLSAADANRKIAGALDLVDLGSYADRPVTQLSGGQMQRVALARSMVYEPRLLLLDEPLSNLDAQLRLRLRDDLRRIVKAAGLTALYVTHDQTEAVVLGDRIGVMRDGHLLQMAPPEEVYNRPADLFVAAFTGASNFIAGQVSARDGEYGTVHTPDGAHLRAWMPPSVAPGQQVRVAVRPENIRFGAAGEIENRIPARVTAQRYLGMQTSYDLDVLGTRVEAIEVGTTARYPVGSTVDISLPPESCWAYTATADDAAVMAPH